MSGTLTTIAGYWVVGLWVIGAMVATLALLLALKMLAWKLYREMVGWPLILKAMREYHSKNQRATHENKH